MKRPEKAILGVPFWWRFFQMYPLRHAYGRPTQKAENLI
jgi:hypothetical protein